ncbi:hypothetical protein [Mesomycoplasma ovipneumoniae]|uniref:hypothetical protein n=1 Tax=Mesomycoplasma ovipneumoniae TaxID=29562 RepID=UPI0030808D41
MFILFYIFYKYIIDLVKKDIFDTEEFKDYKVSDADVRGSLSFPWGRRRTSLTSESKLIIILK